MNRLLTGISSGALSFALATGASAQDAAPAETSTAAAAQQSQSGQAAQPGARRKPAQGGVKTIVVTAQRRSEDLQDVPVAVDAIGAEELDQLNISTFDDYLEQLPSITAGGSGPGQSTIYIRGLASTTPNLTTAGVAGLAPNVSMYLDEQPLAQPGRNLDVYAADLERIEVLKGPQGTLFGASSQAGVVRLITNKPSLAGFDASFKASTSFTKGGEESYKAEGMINVPVTSNLALRAVVYLDDQGGYIDNVPGTRDLSESARFREAGTVRRNGVPVEPRRQGIQAGADLSDVTFLEANNAGLVEENFNDAQYSGFRASALYEFSPDWKLTVSHTRQSLETDGVFFADPELDLDELEIQRYEDDRLEDSFSNTAWSVEGRLGMLDVIYNGAYTDREVDQKIDYTDYMFAGQYLPYYICDGSVSYPGAGNDPSGTCQAPNAFVTSDTETTVFTQELRVSTPEENRFRVTAGGFYSDLILKERNDYNYPGNIEAAPFGGFAPNFPFPGAYNSDAGPLPATAIFRNDVKRTDRQIGIFGEASFDVVPDLLTATFGARYYNVEVDFEGTANSSFCNAGAAEDQNAFGTNLSDLYDGDGQYTFIGSCDASLRQTFNLGDTVDDIMAAGLSESQANLVFNALSAPDVAKSEGVIFKGTVTLTPADDILLYATYSEGFRPGLLNRPGGAQGPGDFTVPFELQTDTVANYELGWKTQLFDRQLKFNGSAFFVDISNLQTTIFDPSIVNLFFSDNAANAEIWGVEAEFTFAPYAVPGLTFSGAFSILDTEITEVLTPTDDVELGSDLAYAPNFQGNARVRYQWALSNALDAYVMPQVTHSSSKYTDIIKINRWQLEGYTTFGLSAGIEADRWNVEIFGENLSDERAQIAGDFYYDRPRIVTNRPLTVGLRVGYNY
ncbi:TonB-dependent receptor plug domain-containing protein [Alteriqipengyuania sp. NZ-12B]|uniref:TonB-dependent receptor plug domain-containing protein n=1 Tax=Alteriqipengyuania abyssalis TaxID=2860200 RepID=A0ABS7PFS0_9SPHN|nr:TonB-dependent receptor plug domain-containing protein [Alteriqipengyuania abyssalis]MBY8337910.1 TonB-dependent receptor plug domain-containing protein [Alteriqipengyuania abyssalis]